MKAARALLALFFAAVAYPASPPDYSHESFVIEHFTKEITFHDDGAWTCRQSAAVHIQSDAAVREFGVVSFEYDASSQRVDIEYVQVRKPDGRIVLTPVTDVQELSTEVSRDAPMYSGQRQKQVPVKALTTGDILEYRVRYTQLKPEIPGQFWYSQSFIKGAVVLDERLLIHVPVAKAVTLQSDVLPPNVQVSNGERIYSWISRNLQPATSKEEAAPASSTRPSVELTTFRNWQEVGRWYAQLASAQPIVAPEVQAKSAELTSGLKTGEEKARALYNYVSTKFRYVSVSLGPGRYKPHAAAEVLANQYGDCKDKHALLAALLNAAGIKAWPALMASGQKFAATLPSPVPFDHVVTVLPKNNGFVWLDTTPEVAPYGLLQQHLRGTQALVIPGDAPASLVTTPLDPPFRAREEIQAAAELDALGTLVAHFDVSVRGEDEVSLRTAFHQTSAAGWPDIVQTLVKSMGFSGAVTNVAVDSPDNLDEPFHFAYDYRRENYSEWAAHRITPPLFPILFPVRENDPRPDDGLSMGMPGETIFRATLRLPKDLSAEVPQGLKLSSGFGDYSSQYSFANGILSAERHLNITESKLPAASFDSYLKFVKGVDLDEAAYTELAAMSSRQAEALIALAAQAIFQKDSNGARDQLAQAERLNPRQPGLWSTYAALYLLEGDSKSSVAALRRELANDPTSACAKAALAEALLRSGCKDEGLALVRSLVSEHKNVPILNNAAYMLADTDTEPRLAASYAEQAVQMLEQSMTAVTLAGLTDANLRDVEALASVWDTFGWSLYKAGDSQTAERYLRASWDLAQRSVVAEHLHRLLEQSGGKASESANASPEQMKKMREVNVPASGKVEGTADFFLLLSQNPHVEVQFISGSDSLRPFAETLQQAKYPYTMPDAGSQKVARRGVLECAPGAPLRKFTLLLPSTATK